MNYFDFHTHNKNADNAIINLFHFQEIPDSTKMYSIGVHPWKINLHNVKNDLQILSLKVTKKNIVAIGECGFDKNIDIDFDTQKRIFHYHFLLSEEYKKPMIIHCVGFYDELIKLKNEYQPNQAWILHGYNKNKKIFQKLTDMDFYISFGQSIIDNDLKILNIKKSINLNKIFIETDESKIKIECLYRKFSSMLNLEESELVKMINITKKNIGLF